MKQPGPKIPKRQRPGLRPKVSLSPNYRPIRVRVGNKVVAQFPNSKRPLARERKAKALTGRIRVKCRP